MKNAGYQTVAINFHNKKKAMEVNGYRQLSDYQHSTEERNSFLGELSLYRDYFHPASGIFEDFGVFVTTIIFVIIFKSVCISVLLTVFVCLVCWNYTFHLFLNLFVFPNSPIELTSCWMCLLLSLSFVSSGNAQRSLGPGRGCPMGRP